MTSRPCFDARAGNKSPPKTLRTLRIAITTSSSTKVNAMCLCFFDEKASALPKQEVNELVLINLAFPLRDFGDKAAALGRENYTNRLLVA